MNAQGIPMRTFSVFAVTSCLVYLLGTMESLPVIADAVDLSVVIESGERTLRLPGLSYFVILAHTLIAIRLYAHAWAMDSSPILEDGSLSRLLQYLEWVFRAQWVFLVSYLPNCFTKVAAGENLPLGLSLWGYYVAIFVAVVAWDFTMYGKITNSTNELAFINRAGSSRREQLKKLRIRWVGFDIVLLLISVFMSSFSVPWYGDVANWKPIIFVGVIVGAGVLCLVQMIIWIPEIPQKRWRDVDIDGAAGVAA